MKQIQDTLRSLDTELGDVSRERVWRSIQHRLGAPAPRFPGHAVVTTAIATLGLVIAVVVVTSQVRAPRLASPGREQLPLATSSAVPTLPPRVAVPVAPAEPARITTPALPPRPITLAEPARSVTPAESARSVTPAEPARSITRGATSEPSTAPPSATSRRTDSARTHYLRAERALAAGQSDRARTELRTILRVFPRDPLVDAARYDLALIAFDAGDSTTARRLLDDLLATGRDPGVRRAAELLRRRVP